MGGGMNDLGGCATGIEQLVEKWRIEFRCTENTDHYSEVDYKEAERKYVKYRLNGQPGA
jgi:hypothetical protein